MRIAIDLTSLYDNFSGIERFALNISKELIREYPGNEYVLVFKGNIFEDEIFNDSSYNIERIILPVKNKFIFNQFTLVKALRKIKADVFLFLAFPSPIRFKNHNIYSTIHDLGCFDCGETMKWASKIYFKISYKKSVKKGDHIFTVSNFSKQRICSLLKCPEQNINIIYDGVSSKFKKCYDEKIIAKYKLPDEYLLCLSTLEPRKNLKLLLKAYDYLVASGLKMPKLVLAGRKGWKISDLLDNLNDNTKNNLIFTGFIDDDDLPYVYSMAKLFVFPSLYEGFGIPPIESMACQTIVLSSNSSCLPEILGDSAIFFENDDCESLCSSLKRCLALSKEEENVYIKKGLDNIKRFSWGNEAKKVFEIININN